MSSFSSSSQNKFWTFSSLEALTRNRIKANRSYISTLGNSTQKPEQTLTPEEELCLVKHYEKVLKEFMTRFTPKKEALPREIKATAFHFFKRFFTVTSVMEFHPKEIMYTCLFLACKTSEYIVSINIFVKHVGGNPRVWRAIIIDQETELLYRLGFRIHVQTPYRALEGLMVDLRARSQLRDVHKLNEHMYWFLSTMWYTDVCLLYSPSLIAFAALMHASSRCKENIDNFVVTTLLNNPPKRKLDHIASTVRKIRCIVMSLKTESTKEEVDRIEVKLAACRNPLNDPSNAAFKKRVMDLLMENYANQSH